MGFVPAVPEPGLSPSVGQRVLKGGTSISWRRTRCAGSPVQTSSPWGAGRGPWVGRVGVVPGTLLGPEGSGASSVAFRGRSRRRRFPSLLVGGGAGGGGRSGLVLVHTASRGGCGWPLKDRVPPVC